MTQLLDPVRTAYASFEDFVEARSEALLRFAKLIAGNEHDGADAVQEALIGLLRHWKRVIATGDPEAYVRRSIVNAHILRKRKYRRESPQPEPDERPVAQDGEARVLSLHTARAVFAGLPPKQRAAVMLRFYEDLSYAQIGEVCGCPESTARVLVHRALRQLRQTWRRTADE
ncbi:MAG: sigma-70 family RNA polymerase sigma factor [Propionibacteriaceae bacterium]|nr:sigma-70 family RNA polymerase sigma factor [Propionibacteriaceae bacterium]